MRELGIESLGRALLIYLQLRSLQFNTLSGGVYYQPIPIMASLRGR